MATEYLEQTVREAPQIEAYKLGLLEAAKKQSELPMNLPAYQTAGLSPTQQQAAQLAQSGLGSYQPYLDAAGMGVAQGQNLAQTGARGLAGINVNPEFTAAQNAMQAGLTTTGQLPAYAEAAGMGYDQVGAGAQTLAQGVNTAGQFTQANLAPSQALLQTAAQRTAAVNPQFNPANAAIGAGLATGQQAIGMASQAPGMAGFGQGIGSGYQAALQSQQATQQPGFATASQALAGGIGGLQAGTNQFSADQTQQFMNPYQQQVIDESIRQINRQGDIAQQNLAAQAVRAGAFGGTREGVQQAELERALSEQRNAAIVGGLQSGYNQSQQTAQQAFEAQQQRQQAAGQGIGAIGSQFGQLAATQAGLGQQAGQMLQAAGQGQLGAASQQAGLQQQGAQMLANQAGLQANIAGQQAGLGQQAAQQLAQAGQLQTSVAGQQGQLGLAAAQQQFQEAGFDSATAMQMAQLQQTQQQQAAQQSQLYSGIGSLYGQQAATQAGLGQQAAQQYGQAAQLQTGTTAQQAQLQQQAAQLAAQQGSLGVQAGQALGGITAQGAQFGLAGANQLAGIGSTLGQQATQQTQLGQAGAQLQGQLGSQQAQMGLLPAQIASQQANIAGQGAQLYGSLGQGIGALGAQRAGVDYQTGMGIGQLGSTIGQLGVQQAALGQANQQMGMADVSMLSQLGGLEQQAEQQRLEAQRATTLQQTMSPYQQLGFLSDIYKGAPSSQMTLSAQTAPSTSPLTQAVGLGISGLSAAAGAQKLFG